MLVGCDGLALNDLDLLVVRGQGAEEAARNELGLGRRVRGGDLDEEVGAGNDLGAVLDGGQRGGGRDAEHTSQREDLRGGAGDDVLHDGVRGADVGGTAREGNLWCGARGRTRVIKGESSGVKAT